MKRWGRIYWHKKNSTLKREREREREEEEEEEEEGRH